jgi:hypothetical protein
LKHQKPFKQILDDSKLLVLEAETRAIIAEKFPYNPVGDGLLKNNSLREIIHQRNTDLCFGNRPKMVFCGEGLNS